MKSEWNKVQEPNQDHLYIFWQMLEKLSMRMALISWPSHSTTISQGLESVLCSQSPCASWVVQKQNYDLDSVHMYLGRAVHVFTVCVTIEEIALARPPFHWNASSTVEVKVSNGFGLNTVIDTNTWTEHLEKRKCGSLGMQFNLILETSTCIFKFEAIMSSWCFL